jgi:copper chaperone CopZ
MLLMPTTVLLRIEGMKCAGCADAVRDALAQVPGVLEVSVDMSSGSATVTGSASSGDLSEALQAAGYGARPD